MKWIGYKSLADITSITAGVGLSGGGTSGDITLNVNVSGFMSNGASTRVVTAAGTGTMQAETYLTFVNTDNISSLSLLSNQDTGDYFRVDTAAHGATTLYTVDDDATAAHFEIEADGNITLDAAGSIYNEADAIYFTSANANDPILNIKNTANDATAARLRFTKDKGGAGADGDDIGIIEFVADDEEQNLETFATVVGEISESANTDEAGKLTLNVSASNGTEALLVPGLI